MPSIETADIYGRGQKIQTEENGDGTQSPRYGLSATALAKIDQLLAAMVDIAPASSHLAITPSDSTVLVGVRSIYVGTGGTVVATVNGVDAPYEVPDGGVLTIKATKIKAATTASDIVAWI